MGCGKNGAPGSCAMGPCGTPPPPREGKAETGEGNVPSRLTLETARLTSAHKPHTTAESRGLARMQWMSRGDSSHFHRMLSVQQFFLKCHSPCCNCGADSGPKTPWPKVQGTGTRLSKSGWCFPPAAFLPGQDLQGDSIQYRFGGWVSVHRLNGKNSPGESWSLPTLCVQGPMK